MFENNSELARAIRKDIVGELEAINQYDLHYNMTQDPVPKAIWAQIRDEEKVHVGELMVLLTYVEPSDYKFFAEGEKEAKEIIKDIYKS
ncbi:MAG: ferritin-like domain-containing protein [Clostridia bacterium]|nr:ferritin-like domain-containing protein [Clostridia bacterium]